MIALAKPLLAGRRFTLRAWLLALVVAAALPLLVFSTATVWHIAINVQTETEMQLAASTRALGAALDNELQRHRTALAVLGASVHLQTGDLAGFQRQADEALDLDGAWVMLVAPDGRQLVNTLKPVGTALPDIGVFRRIFETGEPMVTDLFTGPVRRDLAAAVAIPVRVGGRIAYVLATGLSPARVGDMLADQHLPDDWIAGVADASGRLVARTRDAERFVGEMASPDWIDALSRPSGIVYEGMSKEGMATRSAVVHSRLSGWSVAIGVPRAVLDDPVVRRLAVIVGGGVALFALSLALARGVSRQIARAIGGLDAAARLLVARGEPARSGLPIAELDAMQATLAEAARQLRAEAGMRAEAEEKVREAHERLRQNHALLTAAVDGATLAVFLKDADGRYAMANPYCERIVGQPRAAILGRCDGELFPAEAARALREADQRVLERGESEAVIEIRVGHAEQRVFLVTVAPWRDAAGAAIGVVGIGRDITERKRWEQALQYLNETLEQRVAERGRALECEAEERRKAEAQLRQAQKMEAVGQLTGGIAHDFNNVLTVIAGNLDLLEGKLAAEPRLHRLASSAAQAASRAEKLTAQLLAFSRRQKLDPCALDLNEVVAGIEGLLRRTGGERVEIRRDFAAGLPPALADRHQIETALLNLVINARDAMPQGGAVTVATGVAELDAVAEHPEASPGRYVTIAVADQGVGMSDEVRRRAFEPFFTTKTVGKGTGLGLSMVYGFVRQSGGHVRIESAPGSGTVVTVHLPVAAAAATEEPTERPAPARPAVRSERHGTILVVEDEAEVRAFAVNALNEYGYEVIEAEDGERALEMIAGRGVDLVFSDVVMPGRVGGLEVARAASARGLAVVLTTGYARSLVERDALPPSVGFLRKPYRPADLLAATDAALARPRGDAPGGFAPAMAGA